MNQSNRTPLIDTLLPQARPMALEQRFMFDAAAVTAVTDPQYAPEAVHSDSTANDSDLARFAEPATVTSPVTVRALDVALNNGRKEVAFIDTGVTDYQTLVDGISAGVEVVLLDAGQDGLAQMALWAQSHSGYDAIHVLSHGTSGELQLGNTILNINNISTYAINAKLSLIGKSLTPDGDFLLYGCDIAADDEGQRFIKNISKVTGADISASIDSTGIERMGGDWELEYSFGQTYGSLSAILNFNNLLALNTSQASIPLSEATTYPGYIQVGDFNGDGSIDILTQEGTSTPITLWINNGSGTFINGGQAVGVVTGLQINTASFRVADFDNDGDLDLYQRISGSNNDLYLTNNGGGQFTVGGLPIIDSGTTSVSSIQYGDFNNDGAVDILTQDGAVGTVVTLWLNNGSGVFSDAGQAVAATNNLALANIGFRVADIDNDRDLDLYLRVSGASNDIFLANNGTGQFVSSLLPLVDTGTTNVTYIQVGDFNNDGAFDILTQEGGIGTAVTLWLNDGNGSFTSNLNFVAAIAGFQLNIQGLRVADFDNDGDLDIYQRGGGASDDLLIKTNDAPPTLNQVQPSSNSQGIIESSNIVLSFINSNALSKGAGDVYIYIDDGDGNFSNDVIFESFSVTDSRVSLSGDATSSTVTIDPSGTFSANTTYYLVINPLSFTDADGKGFITKLGTRYHIGVPDPAIQFAGNSIDNLPDRTILSFTTGSTTVVSNAAPILTTPTAITLVDTSSTDTFSNQTGTLSATDADADTIASYGIQGGTTGGSDVIGAATYDVSKLGTYGTLYVKSSDGSYVYVPNASAINGRLANTSETFTVTATDSNASAATGTATLTVNITGVNDLPTDISLTSSSVSHSGGANATVGSLSTTDADTGDTHTYTLVSGVGDTNNGLFNISGTSLRATNAGSMTPGTYTVRVQTTDAASATYAEALTITVVDDVAPTVTSVSVPSNAWYVAGQNLDFTVNFSESVTVVTTGGTPRISLTVGTSTVYADYVSGSGTAALVFRYTVQANDLDTNGIAVGTLALNGGSLADAAGNNAVLTLNSVGSTSAVLVDAATPSVPSTPDLDLASDSGTSNTDNVTSDTTPTLTGTAEAGSTVTLYDTDGTVLGTTTATGGNWSITSTTLSSGSHTITAKVTDAAGNVSSASAGLAINIDSVAPSAVALSTTSLADTVATSGSTLATLSATDTSGLTYSLVAGSGDTNNGRFTITGTDLKAGGSNLAAGTYDIRVRATDAAGNFTDQTFTVTVTSGPSVASINRAGASALTNASSVDYTITYSESVTGVDVSDFVLTTTGTAGGIIASISGSGTTYTVTVNSLSGDGTLRLDLNNSGTGIVNAGTQAITGGYTSGQTYTLDTTAPTAPSGLDMTAGSDSGISDTDNITSDTTPTVTGGGAEAGATVKLYDTDGTTLLGTTTADGSGNWSITSSALTDGAHTLKAKVTDAAGNTGAASTALTVTIDTTAPSVPGAPDLASASDSGSSTDNNTSVTTPTLTGSGVEAGATVTLYDTNGTTVLGTATADGSGNWSITSSTLTSGAHTLTTKVTDAAGNTGAASAGLTVTIDTTAPSAPSAPDLASGSDAGTSNTDNITSVTTPTLTGSGVEAGATVKLYDTDGTTLLGTTTADGSGNWSITSSTLTSGTHTLTTKVTDAAGNTSAASAGLTLTVDTTAPSAPGTPDLASVSDTGGSNTDNITNATTPTITGSGAEAGATVKLYDTDGTTLLGTATADGTGNWSITSSALSTGSHTLTTKVTDASGNTSAASTGLTVTIDTTAPTAIALSANSVMDVATGTNTAVATLSSTDTQSVSYALAAGDGTNDSGNASFVIAGGTLQSRSQLTAGTYNIRIGATDAAGNISYQTFTITVGSNTAPVITSGATASVAENAPITTVVYTATASDADAGQTLSYSLTGTDAVSFDIDASTGVVTLKASANYEAKASYSVNVMATDNGTGRLTDTKAVTVTVTNVNEAPSITSGSTGTVAENAATSTVVYTATAIDVDAGQTLSYSLTGTDAGSFDINASSGVVTLKASANYESKASYSFNVVATDNGTGTLTDTKAVTITVTDVNEATTGSVTINGTAKQGETLSVVDTLADEDGVSGKTYKWYADGVLIVGANQGSLTLEQDQVGKVITAEVRYTDLSGRTEVAISAATSAVVNLSLPPTQVVTAPLINPITVVQPEPVVDVIPAPVASFMSINTVNSIPVLASGAGLVIAPAALVMESPAQSPSLPVVILGVSNPSSSSTSGLRAVEASRDVVIERGEQATFTLPAGTFVHTDGAARVTLTARLADGRPLPANVKFNPTTGTFTVEAAPGEQAEQLQVVVNAVDDKGQTASTTLVIKLKEKASNSSALDLPIKLGKLSLGEQIRLAEKPAGYMAELAALSKAFAASQHARSHT